MRKSDKKLDNAIRAKLTEVCEYALEHTNGFLWLTHTVDYKKFPSSLLVRSVFTDDSLGAAIKEAPLSSLIKNSLTSVGIEIQQKQIRYTPENIH